MDRSSPISPDHHTPRPSSPQPTPPHPHLSAATDLRPKGTTIRLGFDAAQGVDHRRIRQRETVETLLMRSEHLPLAEQALVRSVYADKRTIRELAAMQSRDERSLRRQLRRLVRRMLCPEFAIVLTQGPTWTSSRLQVGHAIFLHGLGLRRTATVLGISVYRVRTHVSAIRTIADAIRRARRNPHKSSQLHQPSIGGAA